jgi:hypothetical protein
VRLNVLSVLEGLWFIRYVAPLAGSANPNFVFVIAPRGEMASFPIGTMPFLLENDSTQESSVHEIPRAPDDAADQKARQYLSIRLIHGLLGDWDPRNKRVYLKTACQVLEQELEVLVSS